jgi:hypothetical protein
MMVMVEMGKKTHPSNDSGCRGSCQNFNRSARKRRRARGDVGRAPCHPDRSGGFASRSSRRIPTPGTRPGCSTSTSFSPAVCQEARGPSTPLFHSQANGRVALRMTRREFIGRWQKASRASLDRAAGGGCPYAVRGRDIGTADSGLVDIRCPAEYGSVRNLPRNRNWTAAPVFFPQPVTHLRRK